LKKTNINAEKLIDRYRSELIKLLQELIKAKSVNPPGDEVNPANVLLEFFEKHGLKPRLYFSTNYRANLYLEVKGSFQNPILLLQGHLDTVPPGSDWKYDPFLAVIVNDRIYGRGAADMKSGLASMAMALVIAVENELIGSGVLKYCANADEEMGGRQGVVWMIKNYPELLKANFAIVGEPTGSREAGKFIVIGEKGYLDLKIKVKGVKAHSSVPDYGVNAIIQAMKLLNQLLKKRIKGSTPYSKIQLYKELWNSLKERYGTLGALRKIMSRRDKRTKALMKALFSNTISPGIITGGLKSNVVPDSCEVIINFRLLPGTTKEKVISYIKSLCRELDVSVDIEALEYHESSILSGSVPEVELLRNTAKEILGYKPPRIISPAFSDAAHLRNMLHIPAVQFGPGEANTAHAVNEYVEVQDLVTTTKIYLLFIAKYLST